MQQIKTSLFYPDGPPGSRLLANAPSLSAIMEANEITAEDLAAGTDLAVGTINALAQGGFEPIIRVSHLQGYVWALTGQDIKEEVS
jgi:hypothetical protein